MSSEIHFSFPIFTLTILTAFTSSNALGSGSTIAIISNTATVCGILAGKSSQRIQCYHQGQLIQVEPNASYQSISGGNSFFCGLRSGGFALQCWDTNVVFNSSFQPKRIHYNYSDPLSDVSVGDSQVCGLGSVTKNVKCWRGDKSGKSQFMSPTDEFKFSTVTSGYGFSCGVLRNNSRVVCWGESKIGVVIEKGFSYFSMVSFVAGYSHACGLNSSGSLVCKGNNDSGQLDVPSDSAFEFSGIALGVNHSCAIRQKNGFVECWGGGDKGMEFASNVIQNVSFESIVAGLDFTCGLTTRNLSLICWGPGWLDKGKSTTDIPLPTTVPGPCVQTSCGACGTYPNSETLCDGSGNICRTCAIELPLPWIPPFPSPSPSTSSNTGRDERLFAFAIVGSVGAFAGICTIIYCVLAGVCCSLLKRDCKVEEAPSGGDNVETFSAPSSAPNVPPSRSSSIKQHSLRALERQKSGALLKQADRPEKFSLAELSAATANFSPENKIGSGSFGMVYKGKLNDGHEVAIKRGDTGLRHKKFKEKESAFDSELALLSRLHHKHLVGLVGYCQENDERLLVYEFMSNVSEISDGELPRVLDMRIGSPEPSEVQAIELVAYTALHCVNLEGKERPTMTEVVANLERALALCEAALACKSNSAYTIKADET
ncbi:Protein kinase domain [Dillenia turbinata]|uniref:Protein kinase domain n=1 Tax=Dillenia turbinata TaxID=194707 RepID=A0AAN8VPD3_9MAGN